MRRGMSGSGEDRKLFYVIEPERRNREIIGVTKSPISVANPGRGSAIYRSHPAVTALFSRRPAANVPPRCLAGAGRDGPSNPLMEG